jgi:SAM-dependent methyltransferase
MAVHKYLLTFITFAFLGCTQAQNASEGFYTFRKGDPNGIGKWYMGREIAFVMGFHGKEWLERPERENEEKTEKLIRNLNLKQTDVIADIGAGTGYHAFKIAQLVPEGKVYAVDIQEEMLSAIEARKKEENIYNIEAVEGSEQSVKLPENTVDKVLMVDVYHEFSYPKEMLESISKALKPDGKIFLVEFRKENKWVPIKEIHKMTEAQAVLEFEAAGFRLLKNEGNLPWQHCMVFEKRP